MSLIKLSSKIPGVDDKPKSFNEHIFLIEMKTISEFTSKNILLRENRPSILISIDSLCSGQRFPNRSIVDYKDYSYFKLYSGFY